MFLIDYAEEPRIYARWVKKCLAAFEQGHKVQIERGGRLLNYQQWRAEFRKVLDKRINLKTGDQPAWRKLDSYYQMQLYRDSRRLQDIARRIRVYQFETNEARSRYSDRLSSYDD